MPETMSVIGILFPQLVLFYIALLLVVIYGGHCDVSHRVWKDMIYKTMQKNGEEFVVACRSLELWVHAVHGVGNPRPLDL